LKAAARSSSQDRIPNIDSTYRRPCNKTKYEIQKEGDDALTLTKRERETSREL